MRKLAVGTMQPSMAEIVPAHATLDTEISGFVVHSVHATVAWFEIWFMGARMVRLTIQPNQSINILKYLGVDSVTFPPGDSIEANCTAGAQINYMVLGCRFKSA